MTLTLKQKQQQLQQQKNCVLTLYLIKVDELEMSSGYGNEWYRIRSKLSKSELRKWSATGPN